MKKKLLWTAIAMMIATASWAQTNVKTFTVGGVSFKMIKVQGGTYQMGANIAKDSNADSDEKPVHNVTLSDFSIGETEVTQELWQAVMGNVPDLLTSSTYEIQGAKRPVCYVSWKACHEFIDKLNALTGQKFHLPTEAEWEYAARGGKKTKGFMYSGGDDIEAIAWYCDNSYEKGSLDVKTKAANELGLYDMSGGVYEWCEDWYGNYSDADQTNPAGPESGKSRVYRGGSWGAYEKQCVVTRRFVGNQVLLQNRDLGLRLAQ